MRWTTAAFFIFLTACGGDRIAAPVLPEALNIGTNQTILVGTTRAINENGDFGIGRSNQLKFVELTVSVPPDREVGSISDGLDNPNPKIDFAIAARKDFDGAVQFQQALKANLQSKPLADREVTVFVHGFNSSFTDSSFRLAQLAQDLELPSTLVSYSWPSRAHVLGYEYDADSALFARNGLEELLRTVRASGAEHIVLVAHSMGGALAMETIRQIDFKSPGWASQNLNGVVLISPDVNTDVFLSQASSIETLPQPFVVFVSQADKALRLSAKLRLEAERLGTTSNFSLFSHLPIEFVDVTEFDDAGGANHFVVGNSPALIAIFQSAASDDLNYLRGERGSTNLLPGRRRILRNATQIILSPGSER